MSARPTALGCMVFAGGFTLGMQSAFDVLGHFEHGGFGVDTARANLNIPVWTDQTTWPTKQFAGVDVVYANPPCAPWSICGNSLFRGVDNWKTDANFQGTVKARSLLSAVHPKVWVSESVCMLLTRGREYIEDLHAEAAALGYELTLFQLDAKLWGLPQQRRRVFVIVHRVAIPATLWQRMQPPCLRMNVLPALAELESPGEIGAVPAAWAELLPDLAQGKWLARLWEERHGIAPGAGLGSGVRQAGRPRFEVHRLRADTPSDSVTGGYTALIHPIEDRFLGVNELARLCGYPETWVWPSLSKAAVEIGRGVTSTAGRVLADVLQRALEYDMPAVPGRLTSLDFRAKSTRVDCFVPNNVISILEPGTLPSQKSYSFSA